MGAVVAAFDAARDLAEPKPRAIVFDTRMCRGRAVPGGARDLPLRARRAGRMVEGARRPGPGGAGMTRASMARKHEPRPARPQGGARRDLGDDRLARGGGLRDRRGALRPRPGRGSHGSGRRSWASPPTSPSTPTCTSFAEAMPERFYQMGMAEQVMVSAAAGLAREGFLPFATTYAVFASRRAYDFVAMAVAEENLPVKLCCALPGLTTGYGPSHQATEDLAIFRGLPGMTILDACDAVDIRQSVRAMARSPGAGLLAAPARPGADRPHALEAGLPLRDRPRADDPRGARRARRLLGLHDDAGARRGGGRWRATGVDVAVLHSPTIKPLDAETILAEAGRGRLLVTAENHSVVGGLGRGGGRHAPARRDHAGLPPDRAAGRVPGGGGRCPPCTTLYGISTSRVAERIKGWL